jgi:hypothetical protein
MCSGHSSKRYTGKRKHTEGNEETTFPYSAHWNHNSWKHQQDSRKVLLLDPADRIITRVSVCAVITFLSIVVWWSAWIPLTLAALAFTAYVTGYRVVLREDDYDERKSKRKNDEYEPNETISQEFI